MREILFRGKQICDGKWVEGNIIWTDDARASYQAVIVPKIGAGMFPDAKKESLGFHTYCLVNPETVCQYTGLTDKNGRKIFEGDIVEIPSEDERYVIEWDTDTARFAIVQHGSIMCDFDNYWGYELEVIGNIFDNPELIGE